ncbi:MAG: hypothetical protein ACFFF4_09090 [Candidatus Thorarchaeota archaeon]
MTFDLEILDIRGHDGKDIMNSLLKQKSGPGPISIIFPGLHYNVDMPLLYYSTGVLLESGHSVLSVDTSYSHKKDFMEGTSQERSKWMFEDARAVFEAVSKLDGYSLAVLVGKSLGTIQIGYYIENYNIMQNSRIVWLTPLLKQEWLVQQMTAHKGKSLIVIGSADPHYSDEILGTIVEVGRSELLTVIQGNHSLDVPGGLLESMKQLTDVVSKMRDFVRG